MLARSVEMDGYVVVRKVVYKHLRSITRLGVPAISVVDVCCGSPKSRNVPSSVLPAKQANNIHLAFFVTLTYTMPVENLREKFGRFRILVIGRANAGKTTILKRVCDSTEDPEIYDHRGKKVYSSF